MRGRDHIEQYASAMPPESERDGDVHQPLDPPLSSCSLNIGSRNFGMLMISAAQAQRGQNRQRNPHGRRRFVIRVAVMHDGALRREYSPKKHRNSARKT